MFRLEIITTKHLYIRFYDVDLFFLILYNFISAFSYYGGMAHSAIH